MSITQALANATSGLNATSRRAGVVSNNIANALTPGYARRDVNLSEVSIEGRGAGVSANSLSRASAPELSRERRTAEAELQGEQIAQNALQTLARQVGGIDDPGSLFSRYEALDAALNALTNTPESTAIQRNVVTAASDIVSSFEALTQSADRLSEDTDSQIETRVSLLNQRLGEFEEVNNAIEIAVANGRDFLALADRRDLLVDEINTDIPVQGVPDRNGKIDLITPEGIFLVRGGAREISLETGVNPQTGETERSLLIGDVDVTPGRTGQALNEGGLFGLFTVRNQTIPEYRDQVDGLARDLVDRFSGLASADGVADNLALFVDRTGSTERAGAAERLSLNAAIDPEAGGIVSRLRDGFNAQTAGPTGNNENPLRLLEAFRAQRTGINPSSNGGASDQVAAFSTLRTSQQLSADSTVATTRARFDNLVEAESNRIGVNTDDEIRKLIEIEQAFSANARVIEVADRLVQRLLDL